MRRRIVPLLIAASVLAVPASASAHGLVQRSNLPIPEWLFGWAAAIVLVISFVALAALWPKPRLEGEPAFKPLPGGALLGSRAVEIACGAIGVALLVVVLLAGYVGSGVALDNFAPTFILITFWVGLVFASRDLRRRLQAPSARGARSAGCCRREGLRPYPEKLGRWPAAIGLLVFTWIELCSGWGEDPALLVTAALGYTVLTLVAQVVFGVETWTRYGETFAVYYNLFSRIAPFETRERVVGVRPPLSGLPHLDPKPGTVALISVMIGTVTFDGLSQGRLWKDLAVDLTDVVTSIGIPITEAPRIVSTIGLLLGVALVALFYRAGIAGAHSVGGDISSARLRRAFIHSLVPIAMVYVAAHYLTFLLFEGQAIRYLASDPFGQGWDIFGTASAAIDYSLLSQNGAWYAQVALRRARPRRRARARPRPRARALRRREARRPLAVLDAGR